MKKSTFKRVATALCAILICVLSISLSFAADENAFENTDKDIYDEVLVISPNENYDDGLVISTRSQYSATLTKTDFVFDGKVKTPTVTVKNKSGKKLKEGKDYTVKYYGKRKQVGKYLVKVKIKGKSAETIKLYFNILPSRTAKLTFSWAPTAIKAKWSRVQGADGYRICLYKGNKLVKKAFTNELNYKFKALEKLTEYRITVTAYAKINGETKLSTLSKSAVTSTSTEAPKLEKGLPLDSVNIASLKWNIQIEADGYVIYMSTGKNKPFKKISTLDGKFMRWCLVKCKNVDSLSFKVRSYIKIGDERVLSPFSNVITF